MKKKCSNECLNMKANYEVLRYMIADEEKRWFVQDSFFPSYQKLENYQTLTTAEAEAILFALQKWGEK